MKYILTAILYLTIISDSWGQTKKTKYYTDVTTKINSFQYKCEGIIGEKGVESKKLTIERIQKTDSSFNFMFRVTTNCGHTERGRLLIANDTLIISDNLLKINLKKTLYTDSLGREIIEESFESSPLECNCLSKFQYKLRDIKSDIRVICFQNECVTLK